MGYCPNCGNWVDEGDVCGFCGGASSYSPSQRDDDSYNVKNEAEKKINRVRYIVNSEMSDDNRNLKNAMGMLNQTRDKIDNCLRQGNVSEETGLKILKIEIDELKEKITRKISKNDNASKQLPRKDFIMIEVSHIEFGDHFPIFKLVKRNNGQIAVYQGDDEIGFVRDDLNPYMLNINSNASELTYLPEISYAQLHFGDYCPDNHKFPRSLSAELLDDKKAEELLELTSYPKKRLITITGTEFYGSQKLRRGMKLKLVREPDNPHDRDAIAVYLEGSKIGYVANSKKTCYLFSLMASELKFLADVSYAEYIHFYNRMRHVALLK